jgi:hypothetical protein
VTARKPSRGLSEVVAAGDRRASLEAVRDRVAAALVGVDDRYVAPLAKQLADVLRELESLPVPREVSKVDDLASRRASRRSGAAPVDGAGEKVVGGERGGRARR